MKMLLLSDGPMPPPPLSAWHPLQLKLTKYCMPRLVAWGSPWAGFLMAGRLGDAPGARWLTGTCMNTPACTLPTVSPRSGRTATPGCWACCDWGRLCWPGAGAVPEAAATKNNDNLAATDRAFIGALLLRRRAAAPRAERHSFAAGPRSRRGAVQ